MNILYLVFGEEQENHIQTYFSICSFLSQMSETDRIYVLTDAPKYYERVASRVNIVEVSKGLLDEWEGPKRFLGRVKIKAIEYICSIHPKEVVVYLDTDTFLYANINLLKADLAHSMLHQYEGKLSVMKSKSEKLLWKQVGGMSFGGIVIQPEHCIWNTGVMVLPAEKGYDIVKMALLICDSMLQANVTKKLIEKISISVAISEFGEAKSSNFCIGHYCDNKLEWNEIIRKFVVESFLGNRSLEEDIVLIQDWDFAKLAIQKRVPLAQIRLKKFIERIFPAKIIQQIKKK
ncbi:hypothetical protein ABID42_000451 [Arcicella rosea]|uniref:hypothetical protein n=1 Tax=Arcicella rosea TaxID=502909 RepID=UPI00345DBD0B